MIIMSSEGQFKEELKKMAPHRMDDIVIKKVKYGEIQEGLELGGIYAFSKDSYDRFYPIGKANKLGLPHPDEQDWTEKEGEGYRFLHIRIE